ncbi:conserved hypothetical protein [Desulfosarcina cetonica]|uniref:hypothetical protein n=1 Tax=Desulfosarcina cetonica TaxID=90730 RepID=UPI0006D0FC36|nr:hypothetical protein [Desulfosarcina cetonica]VTR69426.1 conserved hypothetical protein [Desulfosarcina cetonica]
MMEHSQIARQMLDLQKIAFTNAYDFVAMVQNQAASSTKAMMSRANLLPEEGRKAMTSWINTCQEERDRFKSYVEAGFASLEKRFPQEDQPAPGKPAAEK